MGIFQRQLSLLGAILCILGHDAVQGFLPMFQKRARCKQSQLPHSALSPRQDGFRVRLLNRIGFRQTSRDNRAVRKTKLAKRRRQKQAKKILQQKYEIKTLDALDDYFQDTARRFRTDKGEIDYDALLASLQVKGETQVIGSPDQPDYVHPVAKILHERRRNNSPLGLPREDGCRVALAIEGGGMRGCVSAGMICALHYLNLTNAFDAVYGSSAGTIVGAYFITGQLPYFGPEVYYDCLTTAGSRFIDTKRLLRALGFGLLDPRLLKDVLTRPENGKPVLNLPFLLKDTVEHTKRLDWDTFAAKQNVQPLKIVASGCRSEKAVVMDMENGAFDNLSEMTDCMHASCLLPGIAGPLVNLNSLATMGKSNGKKLVIGNNYKGYKYEPLADALLYEPLPYRSAIDEGATHVVVVRSRPDGVDVSGKGSVFERLIFRRFFKRKNRLPKMYKWLKQQQHKRIYAEDIIRLNDDAYSLRQHNDTSQPHLMAIAAPPGSAEVTRLETRREAIFEGLRRGFARAYDCFVEDPAERGRGHIVAKECYPDEILDYDPGALPLSDMSAFELYLRQSGITPKTWGVASGEEKRPVEMR